MTNNLNIKLVPFRENQYQKELVDGLISFDFTMNMKLVFSDLSLQLCLIIIVIDMQNIRPSITEAQILDDNVTVSLFKYSSTTFFLLTNQGYFWTDLFKLISVIFLASN